MKLLHQIKTETIKIEFGKIEARRTKTGSQMETKNINYIIHFYKAIIERTISKIVVSGILDSNKDFNAMDMSIYEKVEVLINTDDIVAEETLKQLIDLFKNDPKILRKLIRTGTGMDIFEIIIFGFFEIPLRKFSFCKPTPSQPLEF